MLWWNKKKKESKLTEELEDDVRLARTLGKKAAYRTFKSTQDETFARQWCKNRGYAIEVDHTDGEEVWYKIWGWE